MTSDSVKRESLRAQLEGDEVIVAPGAYDCVSARIIERLGFGTVYLSGMGLEATRLGRPDIGLMGMTEVVGAAASVAQSTSLPLISDSDTGYGGVLNVTRTIAEFERAGIAGVHLEDQSMPKKCGGLEGRTVIPAHEMVGKIRAAREALADENFVIIGRSDAKYLGMDEVIDRLNRYLDAGADVAMIGERYTAEELAEIARRVDGPLCVVAGVSPWEESLLSVAENREMGIKVLIYALTGLAVAARAVEAVYGKLLNNGGLLGEDLTDAAFAFDEINALVDLPYWAQQDLRYTSTS
jgi:2-methylisocitrate lyase-like PEP mutase family enzyme